MDFARELDVVRSFLGDKGFRSAVIGGVADSRRLAGRSGALIEVPRPEHLIAMKVRAIAEAPERLWQDMADVGHLVRLDGVDRDEVRGYFVRAGLEGKWRELEQAL